VLDVWIQCSERNFKSITDRSVTSRRLRVDRGGAVYPRHCLYDRIVPSVPLLCHHVHVAAAPSPTHFSFSSFTFNLGVDPLPSVEPFFKRISEFLRPLLFFGLSHSYSAWGSSLSTVDSDLYLQSMPRRPPPTPLHLIQGPLPPRGRSKFTMPSMPRPIFQPQNMAS
jgi:hypothetical protein